MTFVGLDLHKRYITACALAGDGTPIGEVRRLPAALETVRQFLGELPGAVTIAVEATLYWAWLHDQLARAGYAVKVAHAYQTKLIWQARSKTDPIDSRKLAELLRANLLPAIWVPDARTRALRQLLRSRAFLVRQRTQVKNRIHGHLTSENQLFGQTDLYGRAGRAWLAQAALSPVLQAAVQRLLRLHDVLTVEIHARDGQVQAAARHHAIAQQRHPIPGVGLVGALFLIAEIGTIDRFRSSHELAAYAGLVPSTRSSGGRTTHGSVGHASNRWLQWILIEIVTTLKLAPGPVGQHYRHLVRAKGKSKAATAAARKLCCYIYWMLKEGWSYEEWLRQHGQSRWSEVRPTQLLGTVA